MLSWRRKLSRHYSRRNLKCFVGLLMVTVTTAVVMLLKSQYQNQGMYGQVSYSGYLRDAAAVPEKSQALVDSSEPSWKEKLEEQRFYAPPDLLSENITYIRRFTSPFITGSNSRKLYHDFSLSKELKQNATGKKLITWYTSASERLREDLFDDDVFDVCPVSRCKFVKPEMLSDKSGKLVDAVIFPGTAGRDKSPPTRTHPKQVYIYYDLDPPLRPTPAFGAKEWNSIFNWTWSYRRDADIWEPAGTLTRNDRVKPETFFKDVARDKSKKKHAVWFADTCQVPSERELYVRQLQQHVNVDVYGQCGNRTCPSSFQCLEMLTQKYHFYLSFESVLCKDYVTDKFLHMFFPDVHVVPVVMGGADYAQFFPEGSYVDVKWFPSPRQLGEFLQTLMNDKRAYAEFLWRKSHFLYAGSSTTSALCQLCQRLHDLRTFRKTYPDLLRWYRSQQCHAPRKLYDQ